MSANEPTKKKTPLCSSYTFFNTAVEVLQVSAATEGN
jgi:hypothetical protein